MPADEGRDPIEEVIERVGAHVASAEAATGDDTPAPADPAAGTPDAPAAAAPATTPAPVDDEIEIEGRKYRRSELAELLTRGTLRHDDYTRKTQAAAAEKRQIEEERESLARQRRIYEEGLARMAGGRPATSTETATEDELDALDLSPEMRRILKAEREARKALEGKLSEFTTAREQEQRETQQARVNSFIVEHADAELKTILQEKGLPESMFGFLRKAIAMEDPDTADPITGELTRESVKAAIRRIFDDVAKPLLDWKTTIATTTVEDLKKAAKPPAKSGPGLRPAAPGKPAASAPAAAAAGANGKPANPWDDHDTINEVQNRIMGVQPTGDYT